jgi:hypothetical protein
VFGTQRLRKVFLNSVPAADRAAAIWASICAVGACALSEALMMTAEREPRRRGTRFIENLHKGWIRNALIWG